MNKNDPAFPIITEGDPNIQVHRVGLTKLEWFAGMALHSMHNTDHWRRNIDLAQHCFDIAETMLLESEIQAKKARNENE